MGCTRGHHVHGMAALWFMTYIIAEVKIVKACDCLDALRVVEGTTGLDGKAGRLHCAHQLWRGAHCTVLSEGV